MRELEEKALSAPVTPSQPNGRRLIRRHEVKAKCGLPNSTMCALIAQGKFPAPVKLSVRASAWVESEVDAWIESRIRESRAGQAV